MFSHRSTPGGITGIAVPPGKPPSIFSKLQAERAGTALPPFGVDTSAAHHGIHRVEPRAATDERVDEQGQWST
jgi:hypothetical protein